MSQENVEVVRALFETAGAWLDAGLEFLAPEIELHLYGAFPDLDAVYRGHEGVERFTDLFNAPWEELSVDAERFIDLGDRAKRTVVRMDAFRDHHKALEAVGLTP